MGKRSVANLASPAAFYREKRNRKKKLKKEEKRLKSSIVAVPCPVFADAERKKWQIMKYARFAPKQFRRKLAKLANQKDPLKDRGSFDGTDLRSTKVGEAVYALLNVLKNSSNNNSLFNDEAKYIYLQIASFKAPQTPQREIRILLPHSLLTDSSEVCLFTADLQKGKRVDHEQTVEHMQEILRKHNVTNIAEVIPLRQLKTEFDQFELKRALCNRYDFFLSDAKVCQHITHLLGKTFYDRRKIPVPVKLCGEKLKEHIEKALHKSSFRINPYGNTFTMKVAHTAHSPEQICENILAARDGLSNSFPGGWDNVMSLMIKTARSIPVPFYMSTKSDAKIDVPFAPSRRPKLAKPMYGELDGIGKVVVTPEGDVEVLECDSSCEDELEDELEDEFEEPWHKKRKALNEKPEKRQKQNYGSSDDDDDDDDDASEMEEVVGADGVAEEEENDGGGDDDDDDDDDDYDDDNDNDDDNNDCTGVRDADVSVKNEDDEEVEDEQTMFGFSALENHYLEDWEKSRSDKEPPEQHQK